MTCIICLADGQTFSNLTLCSCKPNLHKECFENMLEKSGILCPICRLKEECWNIDFLMFEELDVELYTYILKELYQKCYFHRKLLWFY